MDSQLRSRADVHHPPQQPPHPLAADGTSISGSPSGVRRRRRRSQGVGAPLGVVAGAGCGAAAAVLYTLSNIALRKCVDIDPFLVSAVKAFPTVVVLAPFLAWMFAYGQRIVTDTRAIPRFVAVAFVGQFVGNAAFQVALGIIGLAASVPITLGVLLIGGGFFGRVLLGEPLQRKTLVAIATLIAAVVVLSLPQAGATATPRGPLWLGAGCAAASGAGYALFGSVMRQTMSRGVSAPLAMFISGIVGSISLSAFTLTRVGASELAAIASDEWAVMITAGVFNFSAFVALTLALKALPVVAVNLINASQVAMAATAGVMLFSEPITLKLLLGIALTIAGLGVLGYRRRADR